LKLNHCHIFIMKLKQNNSKQKSDTESLPPVLEKLRQEGSGFKVPDGYFDSLSPRIVDNINHQGKSSIFKTFSLSFRKPLIWASVTATILVAVILIIVIPMKKEPAVLVVDEWTELNMAYDASYAEEVFLAESNTIDSELEKVDIKYIESGVLSTENEPSIEEITEYLNEQQIDTDSITEY